MTRSATAPNPESAKPEMTAVGYLIAAGVLLLLLPVLPFVAAIWLLGKLLVDGSPGVSREAA